MKVYLVSRGEYDDRYIVGIFSSLEKAKSAFPKGNWQNIDTNWWGNGLNFEDAGSIEAHELDLYDDAHKSAGTS
jgi:hypothetical protein